MGKIAFIFSGQGSQYVGMGKDLYDNVPVCKEIFDVANKEADLEITNLCFEGPKEELNITENTQPCVLTASISALRALEKHGIKADVTAGFSLGEYSALVYSGVLSFEDAVALVRKRGKYMQEAVPLGVGSMAAILGLSKEKVIEACNAASELGVCEAVNFNCPGQIVIAGEIKALEKATELCKEFGAIKCVNLSVSGPFHSSLLKEASVKLSEELKSINFNRPAVKMLANITGDYISDDIDLKQMMVKQVMSPVLWQDIIEKMIEDGVDTFIEIGPGKTLSAFVKKINRKLTVLNVESVESLEKTINTLEDGGYYVSR